MWRRNSAILFLVLSLLYIVPVWSVHYLALGDGPTHLYNSWVLRQLLSGSNELLARYYQIDWRPHPNWIDHVVLALLLGILPATAAEKLFVSAIILLLLGSIWYYARGPYAFFAFPFVYNYFLQSGFYNFSLSVAIYFFILGAWWRRRDRPDGKTISLIGLLLVLCYFAHPLTTLLSIGSIGFLWLWTLRGRGLHVHARHLLACIPVAPLLAWYAAHFSDSGMAGSRDWLHRWSSLTRIKSIFAFDLGQQTFGLLLFMVISALIIATAIRERRRGEDDAFLVLTFIVVAIYFVTPASMAGGQLVELRTSLFIYLLPLPWLSQRLPRSFQLAFVVILSLVAVANLAYIERCYRQTGRLVTEFIGGLRNIPANTTLMPVIFEVTAPHTFTAVFWHAADYVAIRKNLVDLQNYEPTAGYFPIRFQRGVDLLRFDPNVPESVNVGSIAARAEFVYAWGGMQPISPVRSRLEEYYRLVEENGRGGLYRTRLLKPPPLFPHFVLLPVAGTVHDVGGPGNTWWSVEQTVRNRGHSPVSLALNTCASPALCQMDLAPGQSAPLASAKAELPFLMVYVMDGNANDLAFTTVVRRNGQAVLDVPPVAETEFRRRSIRLRRVPVSGDRRIRLRIWLPDLIEPACRLRVLWSEDGSVLGEKTYQVPVTSFFTVSNLGAEFPRIGNRTVDVELLALSPEDRVYMMASADDAQGRVTLYMPR